MFALESEVTAQFEVKKSRFLAFVMPIQSVTEAKAKIEHFRVQYADARHVCFAYTVGGQTGLGDDGEPSGTAAKPMFNVITHKQLINVLVVVVRYFGGIKLGAGGLVRAYGGSVSQALDGAGLVIVEPIITAKIHCDFALESQVRHVSKMHNVDLGTPNYEQMVQFKCVMSETTYDSWLADMTPLIITQGVRIQKQPKA